MLRYRFKKSAYLILLLGAFSCSGDKNIVVETYAPVTTKLPPEPVYSRVTWSHLPKPIGPRTEVKAPYLVKVMKFDVPNSNLGESITILAQSIGYQAQFPSELAWKKVSVVSEGTAKQILEKICAQAGVSGELDHNQRVIRVLGGMQLPILPQ